MIAPLSGTESMIKIRLPDHSPPPVSNSTEFVFADGNISFVTIAQWIDAIAAGHITIRPDRCIIDHPPPGGAWSTLSGGEGGSR